MPRAPRALLDAVVRDVNGEPAPLAREWAERPAVVVLLRHFGCLFCKEQAAELVAVADEVERLGAGLVFVGSGGAEHARWFREDYAPRWPVYADEGLVTYRALAARHGFFTSVNPRTWWYSLRATVRGYRQTGRRGDVYQQGAVCIVTPEGELPYLYVSRVAGDHPRPTEVLDALRRLRAGEPRPRGR